MNGLDVQGVQPSDPKATVQRLVELAVRGLPQMFNPHAGMFCYKLKKTVKGLVQEGVSHRYSAMTLLGLWRLEQAGASSPITVKRILELLLADVDWADNIGDLGLLLWLCARVAPHRMDELERRLPIATALSRFEDAHHGVTMHLAWFLTGLSYSSMASSNPGKTLDVARETYKRLIRNQGKHGYFGHQARQGSFTGSVRGRIGSFADQAYPIYALTKFSQAYCEDSALQRARDCALAICEAQGPLGQWWWHYDSHLGRVFENYPVFPVHQYGMAPMTLIALGKAIGTNFDPWIYKGLDWVTQHNELSVPMDDCSASVIWRCIRQSRLERYSNALLYAAGKGRRSGPDGLTVLFECRPYELGLLLYGLAGLYPKSVQGATESMPVVPQVDSRLANLTD